MAPVDDAAARPLPQFLDGKFEEVLKEYDELFSVEDPEETPYKTKYKARLLLQGAVKELNILLAKNASDPDADRGREYLARLLTILGRNYCFCEEVEEGQRHFNRALERYLRSPRRLEPSSFVMIQDTFNQLGALWCGRQQHARAMDYLRRAQVMFAARPQRVRDEMESIATSNHTMTIFYLAQAYGGLGKAGLSARFCAETLSRQLELNAPGTRTSEQLAKDPFDCKDWVRNCCGISDYFTNQGLFWTAEYLMHCAIIMCERCVEVCGVEPSELGELKAECFRDTGRMYGSRLRYAKDFTLKPEGAEEAWRGQKKAPLSADEVEAARSVGSRLTFQSDGNATKAPEGGTGPIIWDEVFPEEVFLEDEEAADNRLAEEEACVPDSGSEERALKLAPNEWVRLPVYFRCFHEIAQRRMQRANRVFLELRGPPREAMASALSAARERRTVMGIESDGEDAAMASQLSMPTCVSAKFEAVREIFKLGNGYLGKSLEHFLMDGWVTEHVRILQELSQMYQSLCALEGDPRRMAAMMDRRIRMLAPVIDVLNPKPYLGMYRQLSFEVGEIYQAFYDLKGIGRARKPGLADSEDEDEVKSPRSLKRLARRNELARQSAKYFGIFIETYHENGKVPTSFEDDHLRAYLTARLHRARMRTKQRGLSVKEQIDVHKLALGEYEWSVDYSNRHPQVLSKPEVDLEHELHFCQEMVEMLPTKLNQLSAKRR